MSLIPIYELNITAMKTNETDSYEHFTYYDASIENAHSSFDWSYKPIVTLAFQ